MTWDRHAWLDHFRCSCGVLRPHREPITNGQNRQVRRIQFPDQGHIAEEACISRVVDRLPSKVDDQTTGHTHVAALETRGVKCLREGDPAEIGIEAATWIARVDGLVALFGNPFTDLKGRDHLRRAPSGDFQGISNMVSMAMGQGNMSWIDRLLGQSCRQSQWIPGKKGIDGNGMGAIGKG